MKRITVSLPDDMADQVEREARRHNVPVSEVMRRAIVRSLGLPGESRHLPWAGLFHDDEMVRGADVDRELEKDWADEIRGDR